jgi:molybdopterin converting factor small subunit
MSLRRSLAILILLRKSLTSVREISLDSLFDVRLNNVPYYTLSQGLDTELRDGDTVTLSLVLLGGE